MANIRVDVNYVIKDGSEIVFRSPIDCSAITGLVVYYTEEDGSATSKEFTLADAHGYNVGDIDHLFAENAVVKVILDVTHGMAFVQNADTNAYLESRFEEMLPRAELDEAINDALAQAKASGEFDGKDGKDGYTPQKNVDYFDGQPGKDGKDGTSVTVSKVIESTVDGGSNVVTFSDGNTVTIKNGRKGSTGATGSKGADGKTPVKGTDYWTEADKDEMVSAVLASLPVYQGEVVAV